MKTKTAVILSLVTFITILYIILSDKTKENQYDNSNSDTSLTKHSIPFSVQDTVVLNTPQSHIAQESDIILISGPSLTTQHLALLDSSKVLDIKEFKTNSGSQQSSLLKTNFKYPFVQRDVLRDKDGKYLSENIYVADHALMKFPKDFDLDKVTKWATESGFNIRKKLRTDSIFIISTLNPKLFDTDQLIKKFEQDFGNSELKISKTIAERDYIVTSQVFPDDPSTSLLWGLNNTGQTGGTSDADIDAPEAWDLTTGSSDVLVAVIDTGVDLDHPDLVDNLWVNPNEIPDNGIDDDQNGFIDDIYGWDFANDDSSPQDDDDHGTHCSGTIGAVGNDLNGITGVNWDVSIMAIKFLGTSGGTTSDAIDAVNYTTLMGVDLTSNSWGGGGFSSLLEDAIQSAGDNDILFVAAAGNDSSNNDSILSYPTNYDIETIISVASTDHNDQLSSFSNFGASTVDIGAPGTSVYSTVINGYDHFSGTSMATPHVSGVICLMKSLSPNLSALELKTLLLDSVDPISSLTSITISGGRLNAYNAISQLEGSNLLIDSYVIEKTSGNGDQYLNPNETGELIIRVLNKGVDPSIGGSLTVESTSESSDIIFNSNIINIDDLASGELSTEIRLPFSVSANAETPQVLTYEIATNDQHQTIRTSEIEFTIYSSVTITGQIYDLANNNPISEAIVTAQGPVTNQVVTDLNGNYTLQLIDGEYTVEAIASGFGKSDLFTYSLPPSLSNINIGIGAPELTVSPDSISLNLLSGEHIQTPLTLNSVGTIAVNWNLSVAPIDSTGLEDSLAITLDNLNQNFASITELIPDRFDFNDGETGNNISDGGNDMYDGGNYISTNLASSIDYSNNSIIDHDGIGSEGQYFTRKYDGLFVFAADINSIDEFSISGNLGADGAGNTDTAILTTTYLGQNYTGFVKRVYGTNDPSVNHIIIVPSNDTIARSASVDTNDDEHIITGLSSTERVYHLLFASSNGGYIEDSTMLDIMNHFISNTSTVPAWVTSTIESGSIDSSSTDTVNLEVNTTGLHTGIYQAALVINSDSVLNPTTSIPVTINVTGVPEIESNIVEYDFGSVQQSQGNFTEVIFTNSGTDTLTITSANFSNANLTLAESLPITVQVGEEVSLTVHFLSSTLGSTNGTLTLLSNTTEGTYTIDFTANVTPPPIIDVFRNSYNITLSDGEELTDSLILSNFGLSDLNWQIEFSPLIEEATISLAGDDIGYHIFSTNFLDDNSTNEVISFRTSNILKSYDGDSDNIYGSAGYYFYGDGAHFGGRFPEENNTISQPSWISQIDSNVPNIFVSDNYTNFDNPLINTSVIPIPNWSASGIGFNDLNRIAGTWANLLSFTVDENAPRRFRVGVIGANNNNPDGRWDPSGYRMSFNDTDYISVTDLEITDLGIVFFDIHLPRVNTPTTFTIQGQYRSSDLGGISIAGIVFDELHQSDHSVQNSNTSRLSGTLDNLNSEFQDITSLIPNRFDFSDGVTGNNINDGGSDMYDGGNFLSTDIQSNIQYSDNTILENLAFGNEGSYFTRKYEGLFILAAELDNVQQFDISGNLGADGSGFTNTSTVQTIYNGVQYTGYIKRVYGSSDPSINHLIIVPTDNQITQTAPTTTSDDDHTLDGLENIDHLYYLLFASDETTDGLIDDDAMLLMMEEFLSKTIVTQDWIDISANSGSINPNASDVLELSFQASGLLAGTYQTDLIVFSNDPEAPSVIVPIDLEVLPEAKIATNFTNYNFGTAYDPLSYNTPLIISNQGNTPLEITSASFSNTSFTLDNETLPIIVSPFTEYEVNVSFHPDPSSLGQKISVLSLVNNTGNTHEIRFLANAVEAPYIDVTDQSYQVTLAPNQTHRETLNIDNAGGATLTWEILSDRSGLETTLENLNNEFSDITSLIPNRFDFLDGVTGNNISDGGSDMYDGGNFISTNLVSNIEYSDNTVIGSLSFGDEGSYFTRKYDGLFVLGAYIDNLEEFEINGNLGADGGGSTDNSTVITTYNGIEYTGYIKRVYATSDPSVNHLIIIPSNSSLSQTSSASTDSDEHIITGLSTTNRLYYLLFASHDTTGTYIDDTVMLDIMNTFLSKTGVDWFSMSNGSGSILPSTNGIINLDFSSFGLPEGNYTSELMITHNDPSEPTIIIPLSLEVLVSPQTLFTAWQNDNLGGAVLNSGFDEDWNGDGISNGHEFFFALDPYAINRSGDYLPRISMSVNGPQFTYTRSTDLVDSILRWEHSPGLETWSPMDPDIIETVDYDDGTTDVTISVGDGFEEKKFYRFESSLEEE